jgi:hypothetical protein
MYISYKFKICYFFFEFDVHGTVHCYCILLSINNKMQCYTIFFIAVNALHVSGGFSAHPQELKTAGICQACLVPPLAWVSWNAPMLAVTARKLDIYQKLCAQFCAPDDGQRSRLKDVEH